MPRHGAHERRGGARRGRASPRDYGDGGRVAAASIDGGKAQRALVTLMDVSRGIGEKKIS